MLPSPAVSILLMKNFVERAVESEFVEQIAFASAEIREGLGALIRVRASAAAKFAVEEFKEAALECVDVVVFEEFGLAQLTDLLLHTRRLKKLLSAGRGFEIGDRLDIDIDQILVKDGERQIGAGVIRNTVL